MHAGLSQGSIAFETNVFWLFLCSFYWDVGDFVTFYFVEHCVHKPVIKMKYAGDMADEQFAMLRNTSPISYVVLCLVLKLSWGLICQQSVIKLRYE